MEGEGQCQGERERGRRRGRSPKENNHGTCNREKVKTRAFCSPLHHSPDFHNNTEHHPLPPSGSVETSSEEQGEPFSHRGRGILLSKLISRSVLDLSTTELPEKDIKILNLLIKKRQRNIIDEQMAEQQKKKWFEEKEEKEANRIAKEGQRREMLFKKRQKEREELNHRLDVARNNFTIAQENLKKVLEKNDSKSEHLLDKSSSLKDLHKKSKMAEEEVKRKNVLKAADELQIREEECKKQHIRDKQEKEDIAKHRKEESELKLKMQILDANRHEKKEHIERMKKLEALYKENVKRMRNTLETKLRKAAVALEEQRQERMKKYARNNEDLEFKRKQALALKLELDEGLSKWGDQVQEVQENNIRRAEKQVEEERSRRRERLREERRSRERQVMERRKESKEREDRELKFKRQKIHKKNQRVSTLMQQREESVERQRHLARTTARLRRTIRSQSCSNSISILNI